MTNQTQLLEEASKRAYYDTSSASVELGSSHRLAKEWTIRSVLILMVVALILWMFSYALVMAIVSLYDEGNKSVFVLEFFNWINETCDDEQKLDNFAMLY